MLLRFTLGLSLLVGCAASPPLKTNDQCTACDLDVDYAGFQRRTQAPTSPRMNPLRRTTVTPVVAPRRPRYRGSKIDLNFKGADIHDVFRVLARVGSTNIVVADDVKGNVTLALHRVPWDQALATIVAVKGLRLKHRDGVYLITPKR